MAKPETWEKLKYFTPDEKWGDPDEISDDLLLVLDDFRHFIGTQVLILCGVKTSGHSTQSYHYRDQGSCAVDCMLPSYTGGVIDLLFSVFRFPFTGVGYYPDWELNGKKVGGLHLDLRPLKYEKDNTLSYKHARWLGIKNSSGEQSYVPMTLENLRKYSTGGINGLS